MAESLQPMSASEVVRAWQAGGLAQRVRGQVVDLQAGRVQAIAYRDIAELLLGLCGARGCVWSDARGQRTGGRGMVRSALALAGDAIALPVRYARHRLAVAAASRQPAPLTARPPRHCLYLRLDHNFDLVSGGSVAHTAGIINSFRQLLDRVTVLSSDTLRLVPPDEDFHELVPRYGSGRNVPGMPLFDYSQQVASRVTPPWPEPAPDFLYARCSLGNYAGPLLRRRLRRPYVCEYNGSVAWIARNWGGRKLRFERLFDRIEMLNLQAADLVIAVSAASRDELLARGINESRILVNPNGVDTDLFTPDRDGAAVRERLGIGRDECVVGFIGTFGAWHGCEVLAAAFCRLLATRPHARSRLRLLLIGDGLRAPAVRERLESGGGADRAILTGVVEQSSAPDHLAACDVLVSPHVPNPDGSPFFGSPTKLFEYMAMGRAIVASDLEQIGELLEDGRTALLVPPGDPEALAAALHRAGDDAGLRARLGAAARAEVLARHTWDQHSRRILDRLAEDAW